MHLKEELFEFCQVFVNTRLARIQTNIKSIQESLTSETKSSAGDKHETGRAMLQLEREKLGKQLAEAEKMEQTLKSVLKHTNMEAAALGSLISTSKANYYLAISAGVYTNEKTSIYCISIQTPIGQLLLGKVVGDVVQFRGEPIEVLKIE